MEYDVRWMMKFHRDRLIFVLRLLDRMNIGFALASVPSSLDELYICFLATRDAAFALSKELITPLSDEGHAGPHIWGYLEDHFEPLVLPLPKPREIEAAPVMKSRWERFKEYIGWHIMDFASIVFFVLLCAVLVLVLVLTIAKLSS